mmetsp:Transcript_97706/g.226582  ORF Transcript_97706/g.226582 Transcript_97706/m.226582 type:complete len:214 (+) Transcript_97706:227-868(+)
MKTKKTMAQKRVRKPAKQPFTSSASSLNTLSFNTLTSLVRRAKRRSLTSVTFPSIKRPPKTVTMRSVTAMTTTIKSKRFHSMSWPKKCLLNPRTCTFTMTSTKKMNVKPNSHQSQATLPTYQSALMPMTMALHRITKPMKGSMYFKQVAICVLVRSLVTYMSSQPVLVACAIFRMASSLSKMSRILVTASMSSMSFPARSSLDSALWPDMSTL